MRNLLVLVAVLLVGCNTTDYSLGEDYPDAESLYQPDTNLADAERDANDDADGDADFDADGDADFDADGDADFDADGDADFDADLDAGGSVDPKFDAGGD